MENTNRFGLSDRLVSGRTRSKPASQLGVRVAVVNHSDLDATGVLQWQEWRIPFSDLVGVNLASVEMLYIGLGDRNNPTAGGTGLIYIDDIQIGHPLVP